MLSEQQIARYSRQIILPAVGGKGQRQLLSAAVAIVGVGDMAAAVAVYLSAAGVGGLTLAGAEPGRVGELAALNPDGRAVAAALPVALDGASDLACRHAVVVAADPVHEVSVRLNAACVASGTPLVWGNASAHVGRLAVLVGHQPEAPCYDCLSRTADGDPPSPAMADTAVAAAVAAFVGTVQATEVIKLILGLDTARAGRLYRYDALAAVMYETTITKDPHCKMCERGRSGTKAR